MEVNCKGKSVYDIKDIAIEVMYLCDSNSIMLIQKAIYAWKALKKTEMYLLSTNAGGNVVHNCESVLVLNRFKYFYAKNKSP